jgi:hypothetical protein
MAEMEAEKKKRAEEDEIVRARKELLSSLFDTDSGKSQWEKDKEALRQNALAREDAKAEPKQKVKPDQTAEKQKVGANEKSADKNVEDKSGASAPLGNLVANTQEKLHNKQQQLLQEQRADTAKSDDQNKAPLQQPPPDHAAAVAAANMARQGSGSQEDTKAL